MVSDLGSKNGTWLNGEAVVSRANVRDGDMLRFGTIAFDVQTRTDGRGRSGDRARPRRRSPSSLPISRDTPALYEELGTDGAYAVVTQHIGIMRDEVLRDGGTVVKTEGDGVIATFASVRNAVSCAVAIQRRTREIAAPTRSVPVRIGINTGDAIREDDDVLGMAVIKAARVMSHASGGEILMSEVSRMLLGPSLDLEVDREGLVLIEGRVATRTALPGGSRGA